MANPASAEAVKIEPPYAIYRDTGVVLTAQGKTKDIASQFVDFLASPEGAAIFKKGGWYIEGVGALFQRIEKRKKGTDTLTL